MKKLWWEEFPAASCGANLREMQQRRSSPAANTFLHCGETSKAACAFTAAHPPEWMLSILFGSNVEFRGLATITMKGRFRTRPGWNTRASTTKRGATRGRKSLSECAREAT